MMGGKLTGETMLKTKQIERCSPPNNTVYEPYGTRCMIDTDDDMYYELWVQMSHEMNEPDWKSLGRFRKDEKQTTEIELVTPDE
jgi:hypothetical protein